MQEGSEQNKTEEATPLKLKKAREKGAVARGVDLGFFSALAAFSLFSAAAGEMLMRALGSGASATLIEAASAADRPLEVLARTAALYWPAAQILGLLCAALFGLVALFEIVQVGGLQFSAHPLKPDFSRLNPAKGLKRLFSLKLLKETLKNVLKLAAYTAAALWVLRETFDAQVLAQADARLLASAFGAGFLRLLFVFAVLAFFFAVIDQLISRAEFKKQMRMSKSELQREHKEREGEPRIKQKRKQLHAQFAKQTRALGDLAGADMLIVNPDHFAVAIAYDKDAMAAPTVLAKGRNHFALALKARAAALSLVIFEAPVLARTLYRKCDKGDEAPPECYRAIADLYLKIARSKATRASNADA